jgi:hypothetical protein
VLGKVAASRIADQEEIHMTQGSATPALGRSIRPRTATALATGNVSARALGFAVLATGVALAIAGAGRADTTPIGPLPAGPVSTTTTGPNQLLAVALPRASKKSGLVWRIARRYDVTVVREVSESDVDANVVLVFKVVGRGKTALVFALTRGDTSSTAVKSDTHRIVAR